MGIVTGAAPQLNVTTPPAATAATTAAEVQPAGLPVPTTRSGREVSTRVPPPGAGGGGAAGAAAGFGFGVFLAATIFPADGSGGAGFAVVLVAAALGGAIDATGAAASRVGRAGDPQAASAPAPSTTRHARRNRTAGS
jgi:hypothetical protein